MIRAVIDTNVLFEGLTDTASVGALVVDAWLGRLFIPCISDSVAYEYQDVLSRKLSVVRWQGIQQILSRLLMDAQYVNANFRWRPIARDIGDDHLVDCAMNTNACVVTYNRRDFATAVKQLNLSVFSPKEFIEAL